VVIKRSEEVKLRVAELGGEGYRFIIISEGHCNIIKPDGQTSYTVVDEDQSCTCPAYQQCKHRTIVMHTRPCETCWGIQYLELDIAHSIYRPALVFECDKCSRTVSAIRVRPWIEGWRSPDGTAIENGWGKHAPACSDATQTEF